MQSAGICTCQSRLSHQSSSVSLSLLTTYVAVQCVRYLTTTRVTTLSHSADPALLISIARLFLFFLLLVSVFIGLVCRLAAPTSSVWHSSFRPWRIELPCY